MKKIRIDIPQKEYNVYLGSDIFHRLPKIMEKENIQGKILLVIDSKVKYHFGKLINTTFKKSKDQFKTVSIISSEKNKSFDSIKKIQKVLIENNFGRDSVIVAIGGGIIGDIAGFAASTFMRGIKYIQIPTTLLASVDSSVGGKTGINFNNTKNVIGTFYQPELVVIDITFFNTLAKDEMLCGLGEIIKYCFLIDNRFFNFVAKNVENVLNNEPKTIERVIKESIKFKGGVVEFDEKETGVRKVLNLGHTFAHAFEVQQQHKLKHGQAVIVGITCSIYLSYYLQIINLDKLNSYLTLMNIFSKKIKLNFVDNRSLHKIMLRDKKNRGNEIQFVLVKNVGEIITDVTASNKLVTKSINQTLTHF